MVISWRAGLAAGAAAVSMASAALAQISTDSSLGRAGQALAGPRFTIPESLGSLRGGNLFHSFSVFNVLSGQSATFTTSTRGIGNVVSRVTGGTASTINGALALVPADGAPNFFFVNPAGVTFGAGASIDVPGAFHVSTADYVKFPDGVFHASADAQSTLSSAPPEAFGFLGTHRARVTVDGGARLSGALMQPFSIVAGDITLDNGHATARAADIRIVALGAAAAEIPMTGPVPSARGDLAIVNGGRIAAPSVGAANAGNVTVAAGTIEMVDGGLITSSTSSSGNAGTVSLSAENLFIDQRGGALTGIFSTANAGSSGHAGVIDVQVAGALSLRDGAAISTGTLSSGNAGALSVRAGDISIEGEGINTTGIASQAQTGSTGNAGSVLVTATGTLSVLDRGQISTSTFGEGTGGTLTVRAGAVRVFNGARISSSAESTGNAGSIRIDAGTVVVDGNAGQSGSTAIVSNAQSGSGDAGSIEINASESVTLVNGGAILSNTFTAGNGGAITINARNMLLDSMGHEAIVTTVASNAYAPATGDAGTISITVPGTLSVLNGGEISSSTFSSGNARSVNVTAGNILIDGQDYTRWATGIFSVADSGAGNAGTVNVAASGDILMRRGGNIASGTFSSGHAGEVRVAARNLTIDGEGRYTPISSNSNPSATGNAGRVQIDVADRLSIFEEGFIGSSTFSSGNAGSVRVRAAEILIDGRTPGTGAAISSQANEGTGNAGSVDVAASGALTLLRNGVITSSTFSRGNAGPVSVSAGSITIEGNAPAEFATGIISNAYEGSGNAGPITVSAVGAIDIRRSGEISSSTYTSGSAGTIAIRAGSMAIDGGGGFAGVFSQAVEGTGSAGTISVTVAGALALTDRGQINSSTFSAGNAGEIHVRAADIDIDHRNRPFGVTGIVSQSDTESTGNAGLVDVVASGRLSIFDGGIIASSAFGPGRAGSVLVRARDFLIDGRDHQDSLTGVASQAEEGSSGAAGSIEVTVDEALVIRNGGAISSSTFSSGAAGNVTVSAGTVSIVREGAGNPTGIFSRAYEGSAGDAGDVELRVRGRLLLADGGQISSDTFSAGNAGTVRVSARDVEIDGAGQNIDIFGDAPETGIFSRTLRDRFFFNPAAGNAGSVEVVATGDLVVRNGGAISSSTFTKGDAGQVKVAAGNIKIDGEGHVTGIFSTAENVAEGNAGNVEVSTPGDLLILRGGEIGSSTYSFVGRAGSVKVNAGNLTIDPQGFSAYLYPIDLNVFESLHHTGISSQATIFSLLGDAGSVEVNVAGRLALLNGAQIESSTHSGGRAGSVSVTAGSLLVDGRLDPEHPSSINARAGRSSLGQTGNVNVTARDSIVLSNGGELSISNDGRFFVSYDPNYVVTPTQLTVSAPNISLMSGGAITAASTAGWDASNIRVNAARLLSLTDSAIATSAVDGDGGSITIAGDGALVLRNSRITTSVSGLEGNGGDIFIATRALVLDTGFIQANTAAADAIGGNVSIDVGALVPSGNSLFVGGAREIAFEPGVFGLNVIQAAAPTGVSGAINISTPALDVSSGLVGLSAKVIDAGGLGRSLCEMTGGSSLAQAGRGGMPPSARDFARVDAPAPAMPLALAATSGSAASWIACGR